jgi:hypothetical protein
MLELLAGELAVAAADADAVDVEDVDDELDDEELELHPISAAIRSTTAPPATTRARLNVSTLPPLPFARPHFGVSVTRERVKLIGLSRSQFRHYQGLSPASMKIFAYPV